MTYFHFTHMHHLSRIFHSRMLRTTESNVGAPYAVPDGPYGNHVGPAVVWLLDEDSITSADERMHGLYPDKRAVRFEVDVPAVRWLDWAPAKEMSREWREHFLNTAGGLEAAEHWFVFPAPIRVRRWVSVHNTVTDQPIDFRSIIGHEE